MEEEKGNFLEVTREALKDPALLKEIYGDLAKPGVKQMGRALETVMGLGNTILWPIAWINERSRMALESNLEKYRIKMQDIPDDQIVGVLPEIGVPIAEKLSYVTDNHLSTLYVNLLATASNKVFLGNAHPSFVNIINNMSPDEAALLENFISKDTMPFVIARAMDKSGAFSVISGIIVSSDILSGLSFPENIDAYLSNLSGLGLLEIKHDTYLSDDATYKVLVDRHELELKGRMSNHPSLSERRLDFRKGIIDCTSFGDKFISACHTK